MKATMIAILIAMAMLLTRTDEVIPNESIQVISKTMMIATMLT